MNRDVFVEMEYSRLTKTGQFACGDDIQLETIDNENRRLAVLSDGLGSGVKANILANMTTTMAIRFMRSNIDTAQSIEIIMDSLPVCEVRKISYATFSMVDLRLGATTRIVEMGNPSYIHMRGADEAPPLKHTRFVSKHWPDRDVDCYDLRFQFGDRLVICSDGVTQSGLGQGSNAPYKYGWRREGVLEHLKSVISGSPEISAKDLSRNITGMARAISRGKCLDDTTCLVIYMRAPRVLRVLTGPPFRRENDAEFARQAMFGEAHTIICGGTTANIIERELKSKVEIDIHRVNSNDYLPPAGRMPGIGFVTEGILTLSRVCAALESDSPEVRLPHAVSEIIRRFMEHDRIEFVVGTKVNEAHQDPELPQELELRRSMVRRIARLLTEKFRKDITINFY